MQQGHCLRKHLYSVMAETFIIACQRSGIGICALGTGEPDDYLLCFSESSERSRQNVCERRDHFDLLLCSGEGRKD